MAEFGFHPDPAAVALDHALADGETDAGTGDLFSMQAFEGDKDLIMKLRFDADAIISEGELEIFAHRPDRNMDLRWQGTAVFYRVADQILKEGEDMSFVDLERG